MKQTRKEGSKLALVCMLILILFTNTLMQAQSSSSKAEIEQHWKFYAGVVQKGAKLGRLDRIELDATEDAKLFSHSEICEYGGVPLSPLERSDLLSIRLGDGMIAGARGAKAVGTWEVNQPGQLMTVWIYSVQEDPGHDLVYNPRIRLEISVTDSLGNTEILECGQLEVSSASNGGWRESSKLLESQASKNLFSFKKAQPQTILSPWVFDWKPYSFLMPHKGEVSVDISVQDCGLQGHSSTVYFAYSIDPIDIVSEGKLACFSPDSVLLTAPNSASYKWSTGDSSRSIHVHQSGEYYVELITSSGCIMYATCDVPELDIDLFEDQPILVSGKVKCSANDSITLTAPLINSYERYRWPDGSSERTFKVTDPGEVELQIVGFDSHEVCRDTLATEVEPEEKWPSVEFEVLNPQICMNSQFQLSYEKMGSEFTGRFLEEWIFEGAEGKLDGNLSPIYTEPGTYKIKRKITRFPCTKVDSVRVTVHSIPPPTFLADKECHSSEQIVFVPSDNRVTEFSLTITLFSDTTIQMHSNTIPAIFELVEGEVYQVAGVYNTPFGCGSDSIIILEIPKDPVLKIERPIQKLGTCNAPIFEIKDSSKYVTRREYSNYRGDLVLDDKGQALSWVVHSIGFFHIEITLFGEELTCPQSIPYGVNAVSSLEDRHGFPYLSPAQSLDQSE